MAKGQEKKEYIPKINKTKDLRTEEEPQSAVQQENAHNYGEQSDDDVEETTLVIHRVPIRRNRK